MPCGDSFSQFEGPTADNIEFGATIMDNANGLNVNMYNALDEVCIGCTGSNNPSLTAGDVSSAASYGNILGTVTNEVFSDAISSIAIDDFRIKDLVNYNPSLGADYLDVVGGVPNGPMYHPGTVKSLNILSKLQKGTKLLSFGLNGLGYVGAGLEFVDGNYYNGVIEGGSAYASYSIGGAFGWDAGVAWSIGWESGRSITKTDTYQHWRRHTWVPFRKRTFGY